jgi:hypothetical protein
LTELTINVQSKVPVPEMLGANDAVKHLEYDVDCQSAMDIKDYLVGNKKGYPYKLLRIIQGEYGRRDGKSFTFKRYEDSYLFVEEVKDYELLQKQLLYYDTNDVYHIGED